MAGPTYVPTEGSYEIPRCVPYIGQWNSHCMTYHDHCQYSEQSRNVDRIDASQA